MNNQIKIDTKFCSSVWNCSDATYIIKLTFIRILELASVSIYDI
jgi:hypothetical protein